MAAITGFKAYDYRGRIPNELNSDVAYRIGRAYAEFLQPKRVVVGRDIRLSSAELCGALTRGLNDSGVDVYDIGLCGTEVVYFATFNEAIDYAAQSAKGLNFHDARGALERVYPYSELRSDAIDWAYRLVAAGIEKGDRVALIAETSPDFAALFCGAIYAGAWPVPLPLPTTFGGKDNYIEQLEV